MLDVYGAAARLGISKWAVWRLVRQGKIPYYNLYRGGYRFDGFELEQWKQQYRDGPKPPPKQRKRSK
jgi:excisionase family DNA binding protein